MAFGNFVLKMVDNGDLEGRKGRAERLGYGAPIEMGVWNVMMK